MEVLQRTANRGSISDGGYEISNSLKLEADNSEYMHFTSSQTDYERMAFSIWLKRTELGTLQTFMQFGNGGSNSTRLDIGFDTSDRLYCSSTYGSGTWRVTNQLFRDTSAWYHLFFLFDTTTPGGVSNNRIRIWVNGEMIDHGDFSTIVNPGSGSAMGFNRNYKNSIGAEATGTVSQYFCGYIAQVYGSGGTPPVVGDFGEYDEDTGIWKPIDISDITPPDTQGFNLDFTTASDLGNDISSRDNNFTEVNIAAADQATDTPTNNFATFNILSPTYASSVINEGSTKIVSNGAGTFDNVPSTMAVTKGKWYCEMEPQVDSASRNTAFGVVNLDSAVFDTSWYNNVGFWGAGFDDGRKIWYYFNGGQSPGNTGHGSSVVVNYGTGSGDTAGTIGMAFDLDNGTLKFYIRNTQTSIAASSIPSGTYAFFADVQGSGAPYLNFNFGGYTVNSISSAASDANGYGTFEYAPPTGYYALCTKNLAEYG